MTSEERRREQRASREHLGGVWGAPGRHFGGYMSKSQTKVGQKSVKSQLVTRYGRAGLAAQSAYI